MKIIASGRNIQLTDAIKQHVDDKFRRLSHQFDFIHEIHVFLSVEKNPSIKNNHVSEVTVHVSGAVVRLETASDNLYSSIDALVDKVARSLNKHKTKLLHRAKSGRSAHGESIRHTDIPVTEPDNTAATAVAQTADEEDLDNIYFIFEAGEAEVLTPSS